MVRANASMRRKAIMHGAQEAACSNRARRVPSVCTSFSPMTSKQLICGQEIMDIEQNRAHKCTNFQ